MLYIIYIILYIIRISYIMYVSYFLYIYLYISLCQGMHLWVQVPKKAEVLGPRNSRQLWGTQTGVNLMNSGP